MREIRSDLPFIYRFFLEPSVALHLRGSRPGPKDLKTSVVYHDFCKAAEGRVNEQFRRSQTAYLPRERSSEIFDTHIMPTLFEKIGKGLKLNEAQYNRYEPGAFFDWHFDYNEGDSQTERTASMTGIVCFSKKSDYSGGLLDILHPGESRVRRHKLDQYELIFFPSIFKHRVSKLRSGEREALVFWLRCPR